jgi:hypothetical protein
LALEVDGKNNNTTTTTNDNTDDNTTTTTNERDEPAAKRRTVAVDATNAEPDENSVLSQEAPFSRQI